ncbi:histidine kinase [Dyadobacter sp. CY327]|uniref:sensor histidine kinase n=1 Tax=Dyadobacter sp. CY327 TaxID=2907301 RepID=UPI001F349A29|nr:histidine kinase [Dyadobacter sp. CY327]MCE7073166.1 histidine kinase [Dyadobacter sp. CY327]
MNMVTKAPFKVSNTIIWTSSVVLGLLSSVPQLASNKFVPLEAAVNAVITAVFAVIMWYFNIYMLSQKGNRSQGQQISYAKLINSLAFGLVVMLGLAYIQQLILSHIDFGPAMLMVEVRGILINLVFYMFLNMLQQNYENQHVSMELERFRNDNLSAQYDLLKQQVNPHFLFNSLNTLKAMVETNDQQSVDFILKLANFYRYTLESRKLDLIHLKEEMEILNAYLFLQKARFEDGFIFQNKLDETALDTLIPPFTLQLLVENCLKHNIVSLSRPLQIRIFSEGESIVVENQIQLRKNQEDSLGVGLKNIELKYSHLLNKKVEVINGQDLFKVRLPIIHEHRNH